ncbi:uncharacterized protein LOC130591434 [Beta vulgaris subsp. vulgaris]|uniref:uncharacterized protein LOC130591434 n=1 Tax=Beta vulgaris subsp. vulgaris TaxID=3555 RepID=UPI002548AD41|nr:uncharacterized protein LOC130591434 [Beta vulgaris subsp. vulgaris]
MELGGMKTPQTLMNRVLCWNIRGLNSPVKQQVVRNFIQNYSTGQIVHCHIKPTDGQAEFYASFVYAFNDAGGRKQLWEDLKNLRVDNAGWIWMGDFNNVLNMEDRVGAPIRASECTDFRRCVECYSMEDMKATGCFYTWNNKQGEDTRVFSKIDRVMCNMDWMEAYPFTEANFLPEGEFDHCPMILNAHPQQNYGKKPFRYFDMWKHAQNFEQIIQDAWNTEAKEIKSAAALKDCQVQLHKQPDNINLRKQETEAAKEYKVAQERYLSFLKQKTKSSWIKDGDMNTKLFHRSLKKRQIQNAIFGIHNAEGEWVNTPDKVSEAFLDYYHHLLGDKMQQRRKVKSRIVQCGPAVNTQQAVMLQRPVTGEEVKEALWSIHGDKAPGPDGFGSHFYKTCWHIVGHDVIAAVVDFFIHGKLLKEVNSTTITLIPKVLCPSHVGATDLYLAVM